MVEMASLVFFSDDLERTVAFYSAIGLDLEEEDHGDDAVHYATEIDNVHVAVFTATGSAGRAPAWQQSGSSFPGFYVTSLDQVVAALRDLGASVLTDHQVRPWGCRAVITDPDGRPVEINQRDHCGAGASA